MSKKLTLPLTARRAAGDADFWRIRTFLREVFLASDRSPRCWQAADLDYWRWHWSENLEQGALDDFFLWETADGRIAAALTHGDVGVNYLQVHPDAQSRELEEAMIRVAEREMTIAVDGGGRKLAILADEDDHEREEMLRSRGYERFVSPDYGERKRGRDLDSPVNVPEVPSGYRLQSMGDPSALPARSLASWRAFHPDEPDDGADPTGSWYANVQRAPMYRRDLDVVVVAEDGEIASFCTALFDDVTRTGLLVLVGTATGHQRRGLGRTVVLEAMRRLKAMGATWATVYSYEPPAHALYASAGLETIVRAYAWRKTLDTQGGTDEA